VATATREKIRETDPSGILSGQSETSKIVVLGAGKVVFPDDNVTLTAGTYTRSSAYGWGTAENPTALPPPDNTGGSGGDTSGYVVVYDLGYDGAPDAPQGQSYEPEETILTEPADPARDGYAFVGWYYYDAQMNPWDFDDVLESHAHTVTFTARWMPATAQALADAINEQNDSSDVDPAMVSGNSVVFPAQTTVNFSGVIPAGVTLDLTDTQMLVPSSKYLTVYGTIVTANTLGWADAQLRANLGAKLTVKNGGSIVVGQNGLLALREREAESFNPPKITVQPGGSIVGTDATARINMKIDATVIGFDGVTSSSVPFTYNWDGSKWHSDEKDADDAMNAAPAQQQVNAGSLTREGSTVYVRGEVTFTSDIVFNPYVNLIIGQYWNGSAYVDSTLTVADGVTVQMTPGTYLNAGSRLINNGAIILQADGASYSSSERGIFRGDVINNGTMLLQIGTAHYPDGTSYNTGYQLLLIGAFTNNGRLDTDEQPYPQTGNRVYFLGTAVNSATGIIDGSLHLGSYGSTLYNGATLENHGSIRVDSGMGSYFNVENDSAYIGKNGSTLTIDYEMSVYDTATVTFEDGATLSRALVRIHYDSDGKIHFKSGSKVLLEPWEYTCVQDTEVSKSTSGGSYLDTENFTKQAL
jgi:uncharacterized repeat protein (TIGR02543 family)